MSTDEIVHLNDLIRTHAHRFAATGDNAFDPALVAAIAMLAPYVPPECPHNGEYTGQFQHGFNMCRKEVINRGPL